MTRLLAAPGLAGFALLLTGLLSPPPAAAAEQEKLDYTISVQGREVGQRELKINYIPTESGELRLLESWTELNLPLQAGNFQFRQRLAGQARGEGLGGFVAVNEENGTSREIQAVRREGGWAVIIAERQAFGEIPMGAWDFDATSLSLADPGAARLQEGRLRVLVAETGEVIAGDLVSLGSVPVELGGETVTGQGWRWSAPDGQIELIYGEGGHLLSYTMIVSRIRLDAQLIAPPPNRDFSETFLTPLGGGGVQEEEL